MGEWADWERMRDHNTPEARRERETEAKVKFYQEEIKRKDTALEKAREFIENGTQFGYIRMPDEDCRDSAHDTLPAIIAALEPLP